MLSLRSIPCQPTLALAATLTTTLFATLAGCNRVAQPPAQPGASANAANSNSSTTASTAAASVPRDDLGRDIKLARVPQRVVTIGPGATETLFAIGAGERLVGRDSGSDYPKSVQAVAVVANFEGPFFEKVVAARPDLIIAQGETWDRERIDLWQQKCGVPVAALTPVTLEQVAGDVEKMGAWLDRKDEAQALAKTLRKGFQAADETPTAFLEVQREPLWAAGRDTLIDDVMRRAGLANAARQVQGYKQFSAERLIAEAPDFYVLTVKPARRQSAIAELKRHPILGRLECVRRNRILTVDADLVLRPGPRLSEGIAQLARQAGSVVKKQPLPRVTPVR
ncbi:MAG: cobalamin transport system substrate-binding protein [Abditibacteriota bacterium]|nr:cobalamin transport system substrate-binding protein [Abditibacteriota bacterium]